MVCTAEGSWQNEIICHERIYIFILIEIYARFNHRISNCFNFNIISPQTFTTIFFFIPVKITGLIVLRNSCSDTIYAGWQIFINFT